MKAPMVLIPPWCIISVVYDRSIQIVAQNVGHERIKLTRTEASKHSYVL